ncbi:MAG: hypothetical protein FWG30_01900 [Eubacteriaceae bacterium]|nr:hypothetical protein [Eubacteriaceae bacterium]
MKKTWFFYSAVIVSVSILIIYGLLYQQNEKMIKSFIEQGIDEEDVREYYNFGSLSTAAMVFAGPLTIVATLLYGFDGIIASLSQLRSQAEPVLATNPPAGAKAAIINANAPIDEPEGQNGINENDDPGSEADSERIES